MAHGGCGNGAGSSDARPGGACDNNNSGAGGSVKKAELQPHPVKETLPGVQYCINSPPPWTEAILLGFQHYLLTLGITVLIPTIIVPKMGGGDAEKGRVIQTLLFVSGLSTLFQSFFGTRLPIVVVGSYSYVIPTTSIILADRFSSYTDPFEAIFCTILCSNLLIVYFRILIFFMADISEICVDYERNTRCTNCCLLFPNCYGFFRIVEKCCKVNFMWTGFPDGRAVRIVFHLAVTVISTIIVFCFGLFRFLCPLSVVPFVTLSGLGLYHLGFPMLAKCVEVGLPQIILIVFISQYLPRYIKSKRPICDRFGVLFSVPIVWLYAQLLTSSTVYNHKSANTQISCRTDRAGLVSTAPWIYIPYPFQWGSPTFKAGEAFAMIAASFVSLFESTGTFFAAARYGSATPVPPSVISRGSGWLGIGVLLNGMLGSVTGTTASVENAGLLALTKVGSRRVIQISAGFMIFFSIFGKLGAFFASMPLPIIAALHCIMFGFVASAGFGFLQYCNLNSFKTKFILGFSFFMGISVPQYFREYYQGGWRSEYLPSGSTWFSDIVKVIFMSHTTIAALTALFLDCTLSRETDESRSDCGMKWWEKFCLYNSDVRNDEFYGLPCNLNEFFPAL